MAAAAIVAERQTTESHLSFTMVLTLTPVHTPRSTLLLFGIGLAGLRAWHPRGNQESGNQANSL
jgi:hypothetical protein